MYFEFQITIAYLTSYCRGFQTTSRANRLAQKILESEITQGLNSSLTWYSADNCELLKASLTRKMTFVIGLFLNGTQMPVNFDYNLPSLPYRVNGHKDPTSQRFLVEAVFFK
jgi:hypothetical protein